MAKLTGRREEEASLAIRAAWLHYAAGLTQAQVAKRLGVPSVKAHRLILAANQQGAVKISIVGDVIECIELEDQLSKAYSLDYCQVVPDLGEEGLPLRALGLAGAELFQREIRNAQGGLIGVGHGRTLAAAVEAMPAHDAGDVRFVSLLGGLTHNYAANPHDVMYGIAAKTGATAYVMPVPFFANCAEDRDLFLEQRGVKEVFELATQSNVMIVGVGTSDPGAQLVASKLIDQQEILEVQEKGGVGELLGNFFNSAGEAVSTSLDARTVTHKLESLKKQRMVALAGGSEKVPAISAVLKSGFLSGLVTDECTAKKLLA